MRRGLVPGLPVLQVSALWVSFALIQSVMAGSRSGKSLDEVGSGGRPPASRSVASTSDWGRKVTS